MELFERLMNNLNDCDDVDQIYHNVANYDGGRIILPFLQGGILCK